MKSRIHRAALLAASSALGLGLTGPAFAQQNGKSDSNDKRIEQLTREVEDLRAMVMELRREKARKPAATGHTATATATAEARPAAPPASPPAIAPASGTRTRR